LYCVTQTTNHICQEKSPVKVLLVLRKQGQLQVIHPPETTFENLTTASHTCGAVVSRKATLDNHVHVCCTALGPRARLAPFS